MTFTLDIGTTLAIVVIIVVVVVSVVKVLESVIEYWGNKGFH